jgi:hypothetical protein
MSVVPSPVRVPLPDRFDSFPESIPAFARIRRLKERARLDDFARG